MDRRMTKSLEGKCGSCRYFTVEQGRECCGFCSGRMKRKGRLYRTYKCIGYESAPTIIEAEDSKLSATIKCGGAVTCAVAYSEEVYDKYVDTAGNLRWTGTHSGEHIIPAEEGET